MISPASTRTFWEARTTALAWRINFGAWLARLAPAVFFVASAFAVGLYAVRRVQIPLTMSWLAFGAAIGLTAGACWWRARPTFFRRSDARVLLESHLRLDARLTAAELGLVAWPGVPEALPSVLRWRLRGPAAWLGASLALILTATFAPVPRDGNAGRPSGPPPSLVQTEAMLGAVKEMNVADPEAVQQLENRARELARRPSDEQYSHSALEAADALREQTAMSISGLANNLDSASSALKSADSDMNSAMSSLASALSGMRDGGLPINKDLLSALGSAADMKNLSAAQRAQLAQQMGNLAKGLKGVAGANGAGAQVAEPDPDAEATTVAAGGGPGGGGDTAPLMFNLNASNTGDGEMQGLSAEALKRFALGDKLGMSSGAHDVDPSKAGGPTSAGAAAAPASGGEAVWVNRLTPTERAALKKFFK